MTRRASGLPARARLIAAIPLQLRGGLAVLEAGAGKWRVIKGRRVLAELPTMREAILAALKLQPPPRKQCRRTTRRAA